MEEYGPITAYAYAAYRPELHGPILDEVLDGPYATGLDIGCGTGHSTRALARYCEYAVGTDPSADMLAQAAPQPGVEYRLPQGTKLAFPDRWFDVVTLAGSLNYCKSQELLDEIIRVCRRGALVVVYDFDLDYTDVAEKLFGLPEPAAHPNSYDHAVNLSDLGLNELQELSIRHQRRHTDLELRELKFLLLADDRYLPLLVTAYEIDCLPERMIEAAVEQVALPTLIYTTVYRLP